ncbi:MAG: NrsF family protein [Polyangiaceae bacterium]
MLADSAPARSASAAARRLVVLGASTLTLALAAVSFGKKLGAPRDNLRELAVGAVMLAGGAALVAIAMPPSTRSRGVRLALLVTFVGAWAAYLGWTSSTPGGPPLPALSCLAVSTIAGALALVLGHWAWRNTDPWTPRWTGARLGALAGGAGAAGVGVACTYHDLGHLLVGHGLALVLLASVGAAIAHRTLRP